MQTIRLPRRLPQQSELLKLNRLLAVGAICLDWSEVQPSLVTPDQLDTLFRGLTLDVHIEYIDTCDNTTISEALSSLIEDAFGRAQNDMDATVPRPVRTNSQALPPPALWSPPSFPEVENEAERTVIRKQPTIKKLSDDATRIPAHTLEDATANIYSPSSRFAPIYEIPCTDISIPVHPSLDMSELSHADHFSTLLQPLVHAYATWADKQTQRPPHPARQVQNFRQETYNATQKRIEKGIHLISTDQHASTAFAFMNRVMWLERIRTLWIEGKRTNTLRTLTDINQEPSNHSWHPFQLAFILLNIPALIDLRYADPDATKGALADLRYFPTSWERTEAYLGLTAYTLGIRRLQDQADGVANASRIMAILRYLSCILTPLQQVATLICACETIRYTDTSTWGTIPFRLGLQSHAVRNTTNRTTHATNQTHTAHTPDSNSHKDPNPLTHCPWCGSAIETSQDTPRSRKLIYCRDPKNECTFSRTKSPAEGLPILTTNQEIQHLKPTLLIVVEP